MKHQNHTTCPRENQSGGRATRFPSPNPMANNRPIQQHGLIVQFLFLNLLCMEMVRSVMRTMIKTLQVGGPPTALKDGQYQSQLLSRYRPQTGRRMYMNRPISLKLEGRLFRIFLVHTGCRYTMGRWRWTSRRHPYPGPRMMRTAHHKHTPQAQRAPARPTHPPRGSSRATPPARRPTPPLTPAAASRWTCAPSSGSC